MSQIFEKKNNLKTFDLSSALDILVERVNGVALIVLLSCIDLVIAFSCYNNIKTVVSRHACLSEFNISLQSLQPVT